MTEKKMRDRVFAVFNALNNIEVKGMANVSGMAGCLQVLKEIIETPPEDPPETADE